MSCYHGFFRIGEDVDYENGKEVGRSIHAVAACIYCGQVRKVYADGRIVITVEEGKITREFKDGEAPAAA